MCGIAGFLNHSGLSSPQMGAILQSMTDAIAHRGPDDQGHWMDETSGIALGHRRLSIRDLSLLGHQPMVSRNGEWVMIYNGETYSHNELLPYLAQQGIVPKGHSDTEIMLEACALMGVEKAVQTFIGMFAFALWHRPSKTLYLVCDRMGIKPLYWSQTPQGFIFGSELKALRAFPNLNWSINPDALSIYTQMGYIPAPETIYAGVQKLSPGTILTLRQGQSPHIQAYWDIEAQARQTETAYASEDEAIEELTQLLDDSVGRRLLSDVPLGAFLSGGIDSSLVVALMQRKMNRSVKTFSIGFSHKDFDEAPFAQQVAQHLGTEHHGIYIDETHAESLLDQLPEMYDEPFADLSQIPTYFVSKLAREHVTVSLSGDGGDELFAGYTRYPWTQKIWTWSNRLPFRGLVSKAISLTPQRTLDQVSKILPFLPTRFGERLKRLGTLLNANNPQEIYDQLVGAGISPTKVGLPSPNLALYRTELPDLIPAFQLIDMKTYLPGDILTKVDRASMAVSLESRVPLLDHRLVSWSWRLPQNLKIQNGITKYALKQVLNRYVPKALFDRPKMGFGVPMADWLRGRLKPWAEDLLHDTNLKTLIQPEFVHQLWREHQQGTHNHQYNLWVILMLGAWQRKWQI